MAAYIAMRIVFIALVLVAVSMLVFAITTLLPANVAYLILGPFAPPEQVRALELKLGLTDPVWQQYLRWAGHFLSGDLGESTLMNRPIAPLLMEALSRSLVLTSVSFVLIAVIGVGLGVVMTSLVFLIIIAILVIRLTLSVNRPATVHEATEGV